jgi:hypothetical protein
LKGSAGVQGAVAGGGMRKPLSGDSGFFLVENNNSQIAIFIYNENYFNGLTLY